MAPLRCSPVSKTFYQCNCLEKEKLRQKRHLFEGQRLQSQYREKLKTIRNIRREKNQITCRIRCSFSKLSQRNRIIFCYWCPFCQAYQAIYLLLFYIHFVYELVVFQSTEIPHCKSVKKLQPCQYMQCHGTTSSALQTCTHPLSNQCQGKLQSCWCTVLSYPAPMSHQMIDTFLRYLVASSMLFPNAHT